VDLRATEADLVEDAPIEVVLDVVVVDVGISVEHVEAEAAAVVVLDMVAAKVMPSVRVNLVPPASPLGSSRRVLLNAISFFSSTIPTGSAQSEHGSVATTP
jgi:hypothetical protein